MVSWKISPAEIQDVVHQNVGYLKDSQFLSGILYTARRPLLFVDQCFRLVSSKKIDIDTRLVLSHRKW